MKDERPSKILTRVWAIVFVIVLIIVLLLLFPMKAGRSPRANMSFVEGIGPLVGTLTIMDGGQPVLTYRYGDQLAPGRKPEQVRSCYIHPLYSLDGEVLSSDFPSDHPHHHGVFWTWPAVTVRGVATQTWHPAEPSLRQHFVKWIKQEANDEGAVVAVENTWKLRESEDVAEEAVTLRIHGASRFGRAIDVEIDLRPVGGPLELRGAAEENKGYGGLCFRGAPLLKGAVLTTDEGLLKEDSTGRPFRWADLSTPDLGIAIFVSPGHPGFPVDWLVRTSYAGVLNPSWPGLAGATLATDVPVTLRYRVYVHRGDAKAGRVAEAYAAYSAGRVI
ncbi:MAG TPA: DUF6807 family protein [Candidatus Latescibacteria bacterium]|nr:DUF6807 family protein [Candidatus Latescibacterota bacterium]